MDMPDRATLTEREAEAWAAFYRLVEAVPEARREEPALDDGWSVKDVLWHVAYWWSDMPISFERYRTGAPDPESDTDTRNAEVLAQGRGRTLAEVEGEIVRTREALLAAWASAPDNPRADQTFVWETIEHYEEHEPSLKRFLDAQG